MNIEVDKNNNNVLYFDGNRVVIPFGFNRLDIINLGVDKLIVGYNYGVKAIVVITGELDRKIFYNHKLVFEYKLNRNEKKK